MICKSLNRRGFRSTTIPLLRIFSVEKAREFYVDFLGFRVDWEHHFGEDSPAYIQASRDGLVLHLTEHHGDCCPGSTVFVWMAGIDEFHQQLLAQDYKQLRPGMETTCYDARCVEVIDPFGNRIRFNENLKPGGTFLTGPGTPNPGIIPMLVPGAPCLSEGGRRGQQTGVPAAGRHGPRTASKRRAPRPLSSGNTAICGGGSWPASAAFCGRPCVGLCVSSWS
jgi:catechol 2,3-dioxygenase-like lactoylglutathione lyase family enzyme